MDGRAIFHCHLSVQICLTSKPQQKKQLDHKVIQVWFPGFWLLWTETGLEDVFCGIFKLHILFQLGQVVLRCSYSSSETVSHKPDTKVVVQPPKAISRWFFEVSSLYMTYLCHLHLTAHHFSAQRPRRSFNSPTSYFSWSKSCKSIRSKTSSLRDYLCNKLLGGLGSFNLPRLPSFLFGSLGSEAV